MMEAGKYRIDLQSVHENEYHEPKSRDARFWLPWIHGGGTFHADIRPIPPWEDYSRGDIFRRRRRPALASPRRRHRRAIRYDSGTQQSWRAANNRRTALRCVQARALCALSVRRHMAQTHIGQTRMWANAQRDGRLAEYRWRPLFNAAKFG